MVLTTDKKIFRNKTAIVSGGAKGIGRAIVRVLAKEGANVSFNYLKSEKDAKALEKEIKKSDINIKAFQADIKDSAAVKRWIEKTKRHFGKIDILINNAGILKEKALAFTTKKDWQEIIDTNLGGVFNLTQAVIIDFIKQKSGNIINIASVSGIIGGHPTNYAASKAGIIGLTKSLAREVAPYNIRVNAIAPGYIETDMVNKLEDEHKKKLHGKIPFGRFGKPEEVASLVKFLASEKAKYITGQVIVIDGGLSI